MYSEKSIIWIKYIFLYWDTFFWLIQPKVGCFNHFFLWVWITRNKKYISYQSIMLKKNIKRGAISTHLRCIWVDHKIKPKKFFFTILLHIKHDWRKENFLSHFNNRDGISLRGAIHGRCTRRLELMSVQLLKLPVIPRRQGLFISA